jgi:hypothetical protein
MSISWLSHWVLCRNFDDLTSSARLPSFLVAGEFWPEILDFSDDYRDFRV